MIVPTDPDRAFALDHVAAPQRPAVTALWVLDEQLGQIVASTTQPMVGQMRLLWWREALITGARGHPVLEGMTSVQGAGIDPLALGAIIDGWEELLEPLPLDADQLARFGGLRGTSLFALSAQAMGGTCPDGAGAGWALADFGLRCSDSATAARALEMASAYLSDVDLKAMPRPLRILVRLARNDVTARRRVVRTPWKLLRSLT
jgi:phytoene synthase